MSFSLSILSLLRLLLLYQHQLSIYYFPCGEYVPVNIALDNQVQVFHKLYIAFRVEVPTVAVGDGVFAIGLYGLVVIAAVYIYALAGGGAAG